MTVTNYPKLLSVLRQNQSIVYLCGAGLSMSLGGHRNSWGAWLGAGADFLDADKADALRALLSSSDADALVSAAGYLLSALRENGRYHDFMQATIVSLTPSQKTLIDAFGRVNRAGDLIATTNYDLLLEHATGMAPVTYRAAGEILQMLRGELPRRVIHLHGAYDPANGLDDIIADGEQYRGILADEGAQFIQKLIGTRPLIIVGCGATVDDPNLSGFLSFVSEYLKLDVPYFYLCRTDDDTSRLPNNITPIVYGDEFSDLFAFMEEMTVYRMRNRHGLKEIVAVDPYVPRRKSVSAFGRMHFLNSFNRFVGREAELERLQAFCDREEQMLWWTVVGEGGIGKSRLLLEWLERLPALWYGFFGKTDRPQAYEAFTPFSDTVVIFDYVLGKEASCADCITNLLRAFSDSPYRLRIVLPERRLEPTKSDWLYLLQESMSRQDRARFDSFTYFEKGAKDHIVPMELHALSPNEEQAYIKEYLRVYLSHSAKEPAASVYLNDLDAVSLSIQRNFRKAFKPECYRPLYLSIYIEVWISRDGNAAVENVDHLLQLYMEKEEERWLIRFNGDRSTRDAYLKLLALACAVEIICINEPCEGYLQGEYSRVEAFLQSERRVGRKSSWSDLCICEEISDPSLNNGRRMVEDVFASDAWDEQQKPTVAASYIKLIPDKDEERTPTVYRLMQPIYPDILRGFIVDYYLDPSEWEAFAKLAREESVLAFGLFLNRAIDDFPDKPSFRQMALTPPDNPTDRFEFYITLLSSARRMITHRKQIEQILISSDASEYYGLWEVELWRRMAIVLTERDEIDALSENGDRFWEYLDSRLGIEAVREHIPELNDAYAVGLHNAQRNDLLQAFADKADAIAERLSDDGYIATSCSQMHVYLLLLNLYLKDTKSIRRDWERIALYAERFPDADTVENLATATREYVNLLAEKNLPNRMRGAIAKLEKGYERVQTEQIAGILALVLGTEYSVNERLVGEDEEATTRSARCVEKIGALYAKYPNAKEVLMAYAVVRADTFWADPRKKPFVSSEECEQFKAWFRAYPEQIEFAESYARLLLARYLHERENGTVEEANRCLKEYERIANQIDYRAYGEEQNQLKDVLEMVKRGGG